MAEGMNNLPAPLREISNHEYHSQDRTSSSNLKLFRENPALAKARVIDKEPPPPATKPMELGSASHVLILQPERADTIVRVDIGDRRAKGFKTARLDNPGKLCLTRDEYETTQRIAQAIHEPETLAAKVAKKMLVTGEGYSEWYNEWTDESGIECQQLLDRVTLVNDRVAIPELKTCGNPSPSKFIWTARDYGYNEQHAFNARGLAWREVFDPLFYFVCIRSSKPFEVVVVQPNPEHMERAVVQVETDLSKLSECLSGERPWAHDWEILEGGEIPCL